MVYQVLINLRGEFAGLPTSTVFGIRYEQTDVTATSLFQQPIAVRQEDDDDFMVVLAPDLSSIAGEGEYSNLMPSLDFDISLTDDLKARMSFSETIGRPLYDDLRAGVGGFSFNGGSNPSAVSGNPSLEPLESQNLDLSFEWYYSDSSYASVGYYRKEVDNFVATNPILLPQFGLADPTIGDRATQLGQI